MRLPLRILTPIDSSARSSIDGSIIEAATSSPHLPEIAECAINDAAIEFNASGLCFQACISKTASFSLTYPA